MKIHDHLQVEPRDGGGRSSGRLQEHEISPAFYGVLLCSANAWMLWTRSKSKQYGAVGSSYGDIT